jgi:hypothetical protein
MDIINVGNKNIVKQKNVIALRSVFIACTFNTSTSVYGFNIVLDSFNNK